MRRHMASAAPSCKVVPGRGLENGGYWQAKSEALQRAATTAWSAEAVSLSLSLSLPLKILLALARGGSLPNPSKGGTLYVATCRTQGYCKPSVPIQPT